MILDEAIVTFKAGHGGAGKASFYPGKKAGPNGGNGGRGGDIFIKATSDLTALKQFSATKLIKAKDGENGDTFRKSGKDGMETFVALPIGTDIKDLKTGEVWELAAVDQQILICQGGLGGRGNYELKSARRTTPEFAQSGLPGQERRLLLNLKLIADFGLIGLPNAGKSSLINELTGTNSKVGSYPFTTLEANLGVLKGKIIADIPGLIEGASSGKGLGIKFLKHIEKVSIILHCLSCESTNPLKDYQTVRKELVEYKEDLTKKKEIIILSKSDLIDKKELEKLIKMFKKMKKRVLATSIYDYDSLERLKLAMI
ncbi:Obg family GTPase CgtA [Candidatus Daviesbacteria bacterium]|nr:Obg family GTPase CgtA [Candidatus Daviesbacteria bacterium]